MKTQRLRVYPRAALRWCRTFGVLAFLSFLVVPTEAAGQDRLVPKDALPYGIHDLGGCKVITIRPTDRPSRETEHWCRRRAAPAARFGKSWHDYYSSLELFLGDALELAEKHVGGYSRSLLRSNTQLVIYNEPYANAMIYADDSEVVLFINDGLLDLIEGVVSGLGMKIVPLQVAAYRGILGVNFDQWLESMRTPRHLRGKRSISMGPEPVEVPGFAAGWFYNTRKEAVALYGFIFAHELAHLKAGDTAGEPNFLVEQQRDLEAVRSMERARVTGYADVTAIYASALMLGMWYQEKYWETEIREAGYEQFRDARPMLHARDWKRRGRAILAEWGRMEDGISSEAKRAIRNWLSGLYSLRDPFPQVASTAELSAGLVSERVGEGMRMDGTGMIRYRYRIANGNPVPVRAVVEVQSRVYSRDGRIPVSDMAPHDEEEGRTYDVVDDSVHELVLDVGGVGEIAGDVWGVSNDEIYGRVKLRVVSASGSAR